MDMVRFLAAIAVVVMIVAICVSLVEDRPAIYDVTQPPISSVGLSGRLAVMCFHKGTPFRISY
jgi:hypothetical protein